MAIPSRPPSPSSPCQESNAGIFNQQLPQAFDVVVVNGASSLCCRPLQTVAEAFAHFRGEVLPAGEAVLTRDHELRVALRQRQVDVWQVRPRTCDGAGITGGDVTREFLCLFSEGLERRARGERLSWQPPFMNRLYPAEARLKEGANARDFRPNQVGVVPLPRVGGALSARCQQYRGTPLRCQPRPGTPHTAIDHADFAPTRVEIIEAHAGVHRRGDPHARPRHRLGRGDVRHRVWRAARAAAVRPSRSPGQRRLCEPPELRRIQQPPGRLLHLQALRAAHRRHRLLSNGERQHLDGRRRRRTRARHRDVGDRVDDSTASGDADARSLVHERRGSAETARTSSSSASPCGERASTRLATSSARSCTSTVSLARSSASCRNGSPSRRPTRGCGSPRESTRTAPSAGDFTYSGVARLAPGATPDDAQRELARGAAASRRVVPASGIGNGDGGLARSGATRRPSSFRCATRSRAESRGRCGCSPRRRASCCSSRGRTSPISC